MLVEDEIDVQQVCNLDSRTVGRPKQKTDQRGPIHDCFLHVMLSLLQQKTRCARFLCDSTSVYQLWRNFAIFFLTILLQFINICECNRVQKELNNEVPQNECAL